MATQFDLEKVVRLGTEEFGLKAGELKEFIEQERFLHKEEQIQVQEAQENFRLQQGRENENLKLQLQIEELRRSSSLGSTNGNRGKTPKLPYFSEDKDDIDAYLHRFERYAESQGWDREMDWAVNLGTLLQGKALIEYSILSAKEAADYDKVKETVLMAYQLTAEGFRNKFRSIRPNSDETGTRFVVRLKNCLKRWTELARVSEYDQLFDLVLREQFLNCCTNEHATFLKERSPEDICEMANCTNRYVEAHGGWHPGHFKATTANSQQPRNQSNVARTRIEPNYKQVKSPVTSDRKRGACFLCGKMGHYARNCRKRQSYAFLTEVLDELQSKADSASRLDGDKVVDCSVVGRVKQGSKGNEQIGACMMVKGEQHLANASQKGFLALACGHQLTVVTSACIGQQGKKLPLYKGKVGNNIVTVLRDTGCSGVVIGLTYVNPQQLTGEFKTCILIDGTVRRFPVASIHIDTPFYTGNVNAICMDKPVYDLIVGNIEGAREPNDPDKYWDTNKDRDIICNSHTEITAPVMTRRQCITHKSGLSKLKVVAPLGEEITPEMLAKEQAGDQTLKKHRQLAISGNWKTGGNGSSHRYMMNKGILYREFQAVNVECGNTIRQVVVPKKYRSYVLKIAHTSILGGHQGIKKTLDKVMSNFAWPGMNTDVKRYCQSCDICQRTTPKGRITKVPLGSVPLIEEPFQRVAVDLIGPIKPCTTRGHKYILVLVDYATRYPEATPLKTIDTETVAECLLDMYSRLGFPKEVLTDQGTQFLSGVMREVNRLLSIRRLVTTPYHAMCNGLVERFNGTLKTMLKRMCEEKPKDWDRYVSALLFAYRETPQQSTGFSPFELLYGRTVRGPMVILKELWTGDSQVSETRSTYQYVLDLQDRLEQTCILARQELAKSKAKYTCYYNKKAKDRQLENGDEVLLLLPTDRNKLLMHWKGPFKVEKKINARNYTINFGHRVKTFHINLLKKYYRANPMGALVIGTNDSTDVYQKICTSVIEEENEFEFDSSDKRFSNDELLHVPPLVRKEYPNDVNINPDLSKSQVHQVKELLGEFHDVLTDVPGKTNLGYHVIKLSTTEPIRSKPYPIPHALRNEMQKEIQSMIDLGIVSRSSSPYASPLVAVAKPDGTKRICCDMRKINQVTIFDSEPIPDQEEIFVRLAGDIYFTKIDLSKGYWQVPMSKESRKFTAFVTHHGLYEFNMMPFGLVNAAATFSRLMRKLLVGLDGVHNYIDDILIHTKSWDKHLELIREVYQRLYKAGLTARPKKCFIGYREIEFLGHVVGHGVIKPRPGKVQAILAAERPKTKTQIRSFLGLVGYYRKFIPNFATVASPLTDSTKKGQPNIVEWNDCKNLAFQTLKVKLSTSPILQLPDLQKEFFLRTDASDSGVGAVLLQEIAGEKFPIAYASKKLNPSQKGYSVIERECLAIVWSVQKFEPYLYGREFTIQTDHQPLLCLRRSKVANGRIMRWALSLQPYRFRMEVIKGSDNVGADYLSRTDEMLLE